MWADHPGQLASVECTERENYIRQTKQSNGATGKIRENKMLITFVYRCVSLSLFLSVPTFNTCWGITHTMELSGKFSSVLVLLRHLPPSLSLSPAIERQTPPPQPPSNVFIYILACFWLAVGRRGVEDRSFAAYDIGRRDGENEKIYF